MLNTEIWQYPTAFFLQSITLSMKFAAEILECKSSVAMYYELLVAMPLCSLVC